MESPKNHASEAKSPPTGKIRWLPVVLVFIFDADQAWTRMRWTQAPFTKDSSQEALLSLPGEPDLQQRWQRTHMSV